MLDLIGLLRRQWIPPEPLPAPAYSKKFHWSQLMIFPGFFLMSSLRLFFFFLEKSVLYLNATHWSSWNYMSIEQNIAFNWAKYIHQLGSKYLSTLISPTFALSRLRNLPICPLRPWAINRAFCSSWLRVVPHISLPHIHPQTFLHGYLGAGGTHSNFFRLWICGREIAEIVKTQIFYSNFSSLSEQLYALLNALFSIADCQRCLFILSVV